MTIFIKLVDGNELEVAEDQNLTSFTTVKLGSNSNYFRVDVKQGREVIPTIVIKENILTVQERTEVIRTGMNQRREY